MSEVICVGKFTNFKAYKIIIKIHCLLLQIVRSGTGDLHKQLSCAF